MQRSGWHRRSPPLATATGLGAAAAIVFALTAAGLHPHRRSSPIATNPDRRTASRAAARAPAAIGSRIPTAARLPTPPTTDLPATPTGRPAVPGAPQAPTNLGADLQQHPAERTAAAFATAYLTFRWRDDPDALRLRCRPWDTDELDAALAGPGVPPDRARRAAARETDDVEVRAVNPQDRTSDHLDASVAATVTVSGSESAGKTVTEVIDVRVVATSAGWLVAEVSQ
jgi:hypothetical protein